MAKKVTVPVIDEPEVDEEDLSNEESDALSALMSLEDASEAVFRVTRRPPTHDPVKAPVGYCGELSSSEMSPGELQKRFGRGKYYISGRSSKGHYFGHATITIAVDAPDAATPKPSGDSGVLERIMEREEKRAADRREMLLALGPAIITGLSTVFANRQPQNSSAQDMVALLAGVKTLTPEQPKGPDLTPLLLAMIAKLGKNEGGGGSDWVDLIKEGIQSLPNVVASLKPATPGQPAPIAVVATSTPSAPPSHISPAVSPAGGSPMLALLHWARETLAMLVKKAAHDADPSLCAEWVLDDVPEEVDLDAFVTHLRAEDWFTRLQQFSPAVKPYHPWFANFRTELFRLLDEMKADTQSTDEASASDTPHAE